MRTGLKLLLVLFSFFLVACQENMPGVWIDGKVEAGSDTQLWIDGQQITPLPEGEFTFSKDLNQYSIIDASYGDLEFSIFLTPGASLEISIKGDDPGDIKFHGDLFPCNNYLLAISSFGEDINGYINQNWMYLHGLDQAAFVSKIDSLKTLYQNHLKNDSGYAAYTSEFLEAWNAEINYGFNSLILRYPERYLIFPPVQVELDDKTLSYLENTGIDNFPVFSVPAYKHYTRAWLDYQSSLLAGKNPSERHYGLKQMDYLFQLIPDSFDSKFLQDYWMSRFLIDFMEETGLSNAETYLDRFFRMATEDSAIEGVLDKKFSIEEENKDHSVEIYKQENGFNLEAHIFKPKQSSIEKPAAMALIHGGGWNGGKPAWGFSRARHFAEQGMFAVAVQYRLTNEHDITAVESMADARDLILWLRKHADSLFLNPEQIVAYGWSAGAHLASSAAIFPELDPVTGYSSIPDALVLISPAVALHRGERWKYWTYNVFGTKAEVDDVDPVEHVRPGLPPSIILQGRDDTVTPLEGVERFNKRMNQEGNHCELWVYDGVGHLFTPSHLPDKGWPKPDKEVQSRAFDQVDIFLTELGYLN